MPSHDRIYAEVTDNSDPENRRRVKVRCPALVREDAGLPFWIEPMSLGRVFDVPAVEERVEILMITGRADRQEFERIDENAFRWAPAFQDREAIPQEILDNYKNALALWTNDGSFIMFDKETGAIVIAKPDGSRVDVDAEGKVTITHKDGDKIELDGTNVVLDGATLVGGSAATYFIVRGDILNTFLSTLKSAFLDVHAHTHPLGPTGPPIAPSPAIPSNLLSDDQKVK